MLTAKLDLLKELLTLPAEQLNQKEDELRSLGNIPATNPLALSELNCQYFLQRFLEKIYRNTVHFEQILLEVLELRKRNLLSKDNEVIFGELIHKIEKRLRTINTITEQLDIANISISQTARELLHRPYPIILGIRCKNGLLIEGPSYECNEFLFEKELHFGTDIPYIITNSKDIENVREILSNLDIHDVEVIAYQEYFGHHKLPLIQEDAFKFVSRKLLDQKLTHYLEERAPTNFISKGLYKTLSLFGSVRGQKLKIARDARDLITPNGVVDNSIPTKSIERKCLLRCFSELKEHRTERRFLGYSLFTLQQGKLKEIADDCLQILETEKQEHKSPGY
ncbi:hypothetical protein [Legionella drancourtii]|uniref:Uncharacterized protein n=1 Tax=Legionella drancourtii LLAP12 TaxID=658187 RepID=G9ETR9_9GAMM|nr:hypothetical protein [Legionella drancourtii]EHL29270.1 hypothetical protein LDG_8705 [Legionella drancourtii LLAP12]